MLVLARKKLEVIHIGHDVVIKVLHVRNGIVRIGIDAPPAVRVLRGELLEPTPVTPPIHTTVGAFLRSQSVPRTSAELVSDAALETQRN